MENRQQHPNSPERRAITAPVEIRKTDAGVTTLRGYAARFGSAYDMGWFTEEVSSRAFDGADISDVRVLFNHDPSLILGRTKSGTARVGADSEGLWYEVDLGTSPMAQNMADAIARGDVDQSSWGFTVSGDSWTKRDGKQHRTLEKINIVFDASPVTFPANPDTSVAKRSLEMNEEIPVDIVIAGDAPEPTQTDFQALADADDEAFLQLQLLV
jgi:HK97 family phage prohead protease